MQHQSLLIFDIKTILSMGVVLNLPKFKKLNIIALRNKPDRYYLEKTSGKNSLSR